MAITEVSICNDALFEIGAERITSISGSDDSKRALICKEQYPKIRDFVLVSHPWTFAQKRIALAQIDEDVVYGYDYQYQLPSDCLIVNEVEDNPEYKIEGDRLLTDETSINIKYTRKVTDASLFSPNFAFAVAYLLAAKICYPITQSRELVSDITNKYLAVLKDARFTDSKAMGTSNSFQSDEFLNSRF